MQQIMVVRDLELRASLTEHFAGSRLVMITEAATWMEALVLAGVEKPDVVVCSSRGLELSPDELAGAIRADPIHGIPVVCVVEDERAAGSRELGSALVSCGRERLLEVLSRHLEQAAERRLGPRVQLLASFEEIQGGGSARTSGFANVLEVGPTELLLEADQPLGVGEVFGLRFFIPRSAVTDFASISPICRVSQSRNEEKFLYVVQIVDLEAPAREKLEQFVSYQDADSRGKRSEGAER